MATPGTNSPLLGYNTNVKHVEFLFHIQTEDSGRDHPHIITHLFTEGTILATKKTGYDELLDDPAWEEKVRQLMKDQHKAMFVELRDGVHDSIAARILHMNVGNYGPDGNELGSSVPPPPASSDQVQVITPAQMADRPSVAPTAAAGETRGRSIFETPDTDSSFGESLISDKSLDEVILTYLKDELGE